MYFINYDLFDMSEVFCQIRFNIKYELNSAIVAKLIELLGNRDENNGSDGNSVRNALAEIEELAKQTFYYVYHKNIYFHLEFLKNELIYAILFEACKKLKEALDEKNFDKAYDLVDAIHCLPDIIAEQHMSITDSYWKSHINFYRDKWDKRFLVSQQQLYVKDKHKT